MMNEEMRKEKARSMITGMILGSAVCVLTLVVFSCTHAHAHDRWANGASVDEAIKRMCCGDSEAHVLDPERVHVHRDGSVSIDGMDNPVPMERVLPSVDGKIYGFWAPGVGSNAYVRCLFYSGSI